MLVLKVIGTHYRADKVERDGFAEYFGFHLAFAIEYQVRTGITTDLWEWRF